MRIISRESPDERKLKSLFRTLFTLLLPQSDNLFINNILEMKKEEFIITLALSIFFSAITSVITTLILVSILK
jgi:hypothetical protein